MHSRLHALQEDHSRIRALLRNCESASPQDLVVSLRRLEEMFAPHREAKLALYDDSVRACQEAGDKTSVSVLSIFRANLKVTSSAILDFLRTPNPDPRRLHERFRTVASTLHSMLTNEEKVVFPLCTLYAQRLKDHV